MVENRPVAAYTLAIVGISLQAVAAILISYIIIFVPAFITRWVSQGEHMMGPWMMEFPFVHSLIGVILWVSITVIVIALGIYGTLLMSSKELARVRAGATLVLVASIIAFPTLWGFMMGSFLMFIGSLLGLTWQPPTPT